jgi:hypothetical protein
MASEVWRGCRPCTRRPQRPQRPTEMRNSMRSTRGSGVPESRFGTEKRSRTLPARLRIADTGPAAVPQQFHRLYRGGVADIGAHTAFLLCVGIFGDGLWVSAARLGPLVASQFVAPLPTVAAGVRSLASTSMSRSSRAIFSAVFSSATSTN